MNKSLIVLLKMTALLMFATILLSCATSGNGASISLHEAIEQSAERISTDLPKGSIIAVTAFETNDIALSNYIISELNGALVDRGMIVVSRNSLEYIEKELNYQMSGAVSDETAQSIGKFFGAEVIVVGELRNLGGTYRYRTEAIYVEEARQGSAVRLDVRNDRTIRAFANQPTRTEITQETIPQSALNFIERGISFAMRGDYDTAIMDFTEAIKLNPNLLGAYLLRGRALFASAAEWVNSQGENFSTVMVGNVPKENWIILDRAIEDYNRAIELNPNNASAYFDRGLIFYNKEDYNNAIMQLTQAIRLNPNSVSYYNIRGRSYAKNKDYDRAITDFTQLIRFEPRNADYYFIRGYTYYEMGSYGGYYRAVEDLETAKRLDRTNDPFITDYLDRARRALQASLR